MSDHSHLEQLLQELAHYAAGGDVHPHVEQMAREIEHYKEGGPEKPYRDPETLNIGDWKWHPMEHIERQLSARRELPEHVLPYAEYMQHMADRARNGGISPRDLIKAHTITQSSIGRVGNPYDF